MLRSIVRKDLDRYQFSLLKKKRKWLPFVRCLIFSYGFQATVVYRLGWWASCRQKNTLYIKLVKSATLILYAVLVVLIRMMYSINISRKAKIGAGLYIGHFGNIKLGKCIIGEYCSIQQSVHIEEDRRKENGLTHIGSRVWIGGHVRICPGVVIGNRATISAGSVVSDDVAAGSLVVGNPGRIINKNYDNSKILGL